MKVEKEKNKRKKTRAHDLFFSFFHFLLAKFFESFSALPLSLAPPLTLLFPDRRRCRHLRSNRRGGCRPPRPSAAPPRAERRRQHRRRSPFLRHRPSSHLKFSIICSTSTSPRLRRRSLLCLRSRLGRSISIFAMGTSSRRPSTSMEGVSLKGGRPFLFSLRSIIGALFLSEKRRERSAESFFSFRFYRFRTSSLLSFSFALAFLPPGL